jgi:hypothetical protein
VAYVVSDALTGAGRGAVAAAVLALALIVSDNAVAQTPEGLAAADHLITVQKPGEMMKDMAASVVARLPGLSENQKQAFVAEMTDPGFMARYQAQMRTSLARHLTVEELNALADFYSKPVAASAMKKMGVITAESMTFMQAEMPAMIARISKTQ